MLARSISNWSQQKAFERMHIKKINEVSKYALDTKKSEAIQV